MSNVVGPQIGPESGSYYAYFAGQQSDYDEITQTITTTPGDLYEISFWYDYTSGNNGTNQDFDLLWNGLIRARVLNEATSVAPFLAYVNFSFALEATGTTTQFGFEGFDATGDFLLDNVVVTDIGPLVPEPAAMWLTAAGLTVIGVWQRLRRTAR